MSEKSFYLPKKVTFPSKDGLVIRADFYPAKTPCGFLVLCHRSHFNRGEYKEVAPMLVQQGYSCLAIDQRSGMNVLGFVNETSTSAKKQKLPTGYWDAQPDIEAAVDYAFEKNSRKPITLVGSSYSASLALLIAQDTKKVKAVAAFSPGEYLKGIKLAEKLKGFSTPVFGTSAKKESAEVKNLFRLVPKKHVTHFIPTVEGFHGAKSLWPSMVGNEQYWEAFLAFLSCL